MSDCTLTYCQATCIRAERCLGAHVWGRDQWIATCLVYEYGAKLFGATAHDRTDVRAPLGGIRKRAFDITFTSLALIVLAPILLAAAGLIRLLIRKSVLVTDECIGFGGK